MPTSRILIVEDESIVAEDIKRSLTVLGYDVMGIFSSGEEAIAEIKNRRPELVLMDIVLKGKMDGIETAARITDEFNVPVIYLTAYADDRTLDRAKITETFGYLIKPFEDRELQSTIKLALHKHAMLKRLRESEKWFHTTLDSIGDGVIAANNAGLINYLNPAAENLTGWSLEEARFQSLETILSVRQFESDAPCQIDINQFILSGKKSESLTDLKLISRSEREIPVECRITPIQNEAGEPVGCVLIIQNISERLLAQEQLKKSEQEKNLILRSVSEMVTYQDLNLNIIWANNAAGELFNMDPESLVGKSCRDVWSLRNVSSGCCPVDEVIETGEPVSVEMNSEDGRIWSVKGYPVRNESGDLIGLVEVSREITREKQMEADKLAAEKQLQQMQKMEAIGTLTGGVAHDFNNLLTSIQGSADMAIVKISEEDPIYRDLREIQSASARAANLTRQLLLFSRKHPTTFVAVNLNRTISNLLRMLERLIGENIRINTALTPDIWTVRVDQGNMEQVIMNLVVNARDAMPQGGRVVIETRNVIFDGQCEDMPESRPGKFVCLTVTDLGAGIDPEIIHRIFEPFFSTKGPSEGTGLGLSVVYGIIKQHTGWITVRSDPGAGTTFSVYIPSVTETVEEPRDPRISMRDIQGHGEHVLIVEDAEGVREFAIMALSENGYQVTPVSDAKEALALIHKKRMKPDLLFTDVVLPDINGLELIREVRRHIKDIKVIVTSGYTDNKAQWPEIQDKGYYFLQKPYTLVQLLRAFRQVLG